jgi:acetoin utilization deacetylase AcuC-like enzyme
MVADAASFSPSAMKPAQAVDSWLKAGFDIQIVEPAPVTFEQLCLAHDRDYVADVLACRINNGFGNKSRDVADSLPYTNGAMLDAAKAALVDGFACAPVSGFHHASWDHAFGFCTFNGLMVTAMSLLAAVAKVGILDCDQHYGDGTDDIIDHLAVQDRVEHVSVGRRRNNAEHYGDGTDDIIDHLAVQDRVEHVSVGRRRNNADQFLLGLDKLVRSFAGCDILLYQAGADPHVDDPLGGWLTTDELRQRDRIVFKTVKAMGLPCCFNLAGGYPL